MTGREFERKVARMLGADLRPMSGAGRAKGDMAIGSFLVEAKVTAANSITIKGDWLDKITGEALRSGCYPALIIGLREGREVWAVVPLSLFAELVEILRKEG